MYPKAYNKRVDALVHSLSLESIASIEYRVDSDTYYISKLVKSYRVLTSKERFDLLLHKIKDNILLVDSYHILNALSMDGTQEERLNRLTLLRELREKNKPEVISRFILDMLGKDLNKVVRSIIKVGSAKRFLSSDSNELSYNTFFIYQV